MYLIFIKYILTSRNASIALSVPSIFLKDSTEVNSSIILKGVANDSNFDEFNKSILKDKIHFKCQYHEAFRSKLDFSNFTLLRNIC